jgi:hypothetical protein
MAAPGGLTELGDRLSSWDELVGEVVKKQGSPRVIADANASNAKELRVPDWQAAPARVRACLGLGRADRLCDARGSSGKTGRQLFQEEYAEWRLIRDEDGPLRFELTTELAAYWELLARHRPERLAELVAEFAGEPLLGAADVLGVSFGRSSSEADRAEEWKAFLTGEFNDGTRAITCLSRDDNSLSALINLVSASAVPLLTDDLQSGERRFPSAREAIPELAPGAAQDCRASDPVVVERIVRAATEGRLIRFDDPIGIYVVAFQHAGLLTPSGEPIPDSWATLSRQGPPPADGLTRHQRLVLEVPTGAGFRLGDLVSRRTGERIRWGGQLAELVELAVHVRVGRAGALPVEPRAIPSTDLGPCVRRAECQTLQSDTDEFEAEL